MFDTLEALLCLHGPHAKGRALGALPPRHAAATEISVRGEALDCLVYAWGARHLLNVNLDVRAATLAGGIVRSGLGHARGAGEMHVQGSTLSDNVHPDRHRRGARERGRHPCGDCGCALAGMISRAEEAGDRVDRRPTVPRAAPIRIPRRRLEVVGTEIVVA